MISESDVGHYNEDCCERSSFAVGLGLPREDRHPLCRHLEGPILVSARCAAVGWPCAGCLTKQNKQPGRDVGRQRARPTNLRLPAGINKGGNSALTRCTTGFVRERKALHTVSRARFCYCLRTRSSTYSRTARPFLRRMPGGWVVWLSIYNSIQFNLHKGWIEK